MTRHAITEIIVKDPTSYPRAGKDAKVVASHVSVRYRGWRKINRRNLALDTTTKAILALGDIVILNAGRYQHYQT